MRRREQTRSSSRQDVLTLSGRLRKKFRPAIYFDTSVLIDYLVAEGLDAPEPEDLMPTRGERKSPLREYRDVLDKVFFKEGRLGKVFQIRKLCGGEPPTSHSEAVAKTLSVITAITSPLAILEVKEWHARTMLRQAVGEQVGVRFVQRSSTKEIGDRIRRLWDLRQKEVKLHPRSKEVTGLQIVIDDLTFHTVHGFDGITIPDIQAFSLTLADALWEPSFYAMVQTGAADILHIRFAHHLGCKYFATFDRDFERIADVVQKETDMTVLSTPEGIIRVLKSALKSWV